MRKFFLLLAIISAEHQVIAQGSFSPQAGLPGSDAIEASSDVFRDWAIDCQLVRGLRQIDLPDSGLTSSGAAIYTLGKPDAPLVASLGDGGMATLVFSAPIFDGDGADFAVFENGFGYAENAFLEFAFVEVSSNGIDFFRFPAISEIQSNTQVASFENTDASMVHNLAGKYIANYGVPFDLSEIPDTSLLDKQNVTHVRVIDVVGNIDSSYASYDDLGNIINDPWPTNFPQGGFDLDAVGVINSKIPLGVSEMTPLNNSQETYLFDLLGRPLPPNAHSNAPRVILSNGKKICVLSN